MFLQFTALRGTAVDAVPSQGEQVVAVATTADIPARKLVLVRVSCQNVTAESGATNQHLTLTDSAGNVYAKVGEASEVPDGFHEGVTVSMWWLHPAEAVPAGTVLTATFAADSPGRAIAVAEYDTLDAFYDVTLAGAAVAAGMQEVPGTFSVTLDGLADADHTFIGAGAQNGSLGSGFALDGTFATDRSAVTVNGASAGNNSTLWGQYRLVRTDAQVWQMMTTAPRHWALVLAAFDLIEPPPPPPEAGTREYRAHFETPHHAVSRLTTSRRPDAVAWDPRWARTTGPDEIDQAAFAPEVRRWQVRCDGPDVYLARATATHEEWEPETLLTTAPGDEPIVECDVAFTEENTIVVVAERPTGSGGAAECWIYWYDPRFPSYRWQNLGAGRTPRCCNDYFPPTVGPHVCPPEIDVQVCYMQPGTGMVRLEQSTYYDEEFPTVLTDNNHRCLQQMFRTEDRRVCVLYGQRTPSTGRWHLGRVDSVPYPDSLLRRPNLVNWSDPAFDVMRGLEDAWGGDSISTDGYALRVITQDPCDAIEAVASAVYPTGATDFDQQWQEVTSGYDAGESNDFTFSISHGAGTCSLVAFRARVRRTVGEKTCYSPWRYTVMPTNSVSSDADNIVAHCDRDLIVDVPGYLVGWARHGLAEGLRETGASARLDPRPFVCTDPPVATPLGWWFVGGSQNHEPSFPFPTHLQRFVYRRRAFEPFSFSDEDGHYAGTVIGSVQSSTGGSPVAIKPEFDWPSSRFPRQFPEDDGTMPDMPATIDIIGTTG